MNQDLLDRAGPHRMDQDSKGRMGAHRMDQNLVGIVKNQGPVGRIRELHDGSDPRRNP